MSTAGNRWQLLMLVGLALVAYAAALGGVFVFDDVHSVAANPALQGDVDWWRLVSDPGAFSAGTSRMYRPVLLLSFALTGLLGTGAWLWKAGNLLLHVLAVMAARRWLACLRVPPRAAFAAGALFAVHPLASEAINLVSARSELLLLVGILAGLVSHAEGRRRGLAWLAVGGPLLGTCIACGSKETGVVLPLLVLLQEWWWRRPAGASGRWRDRLVVVLPSAAAVVGYLLLRRHLLGQATVELLGRSGADPSSGYGRDLVTQLATMGLLLPRALFAGLWPTDLSIDPEVTFRHTFADPWVVLGWSVVVVISVVAAWPGRHERVRRLALALGWTTALPWIVVPLNMPLAEHRLYGPLLAGLVVGALLLAPRWRQWRRSLPRLTMVAGWSVLALGAGLATMRSLDYRQERRLWQNELAARPFAWRAWWGLGAVLLREGDLVEAVAALGNAHALYPLHLDVHRNYAEALVRLPQELAQPAASLRVTESLLARSPGDPWLRILSAEANLQQARATGDPAPAERAEALALSCLEIATPKALVFRVAASACRVRGDHAGALRHLDAALARGFQVVALRLDRAAVLAAAGRGDEARRELARAQAMAPLDPAVQEALRQAAAPGR